VHLEAIGAVGDSQNTGNNARPTESYRVEALAKGLSILSLFARHGTPLTLTEVAKLTGIPLPTTFRLIATLELAGYLDRLPTGNYRPGLAVLMLGRGVLQASGLVEVAREPLETYNRRIGETVNLAVLHDSDVLFLIRLRNADLVVANIHVGSTLPAVYSSLGKILLAHLDPKERLRRIRSKQLPGSFGPKAVSSIRELEVQLDEVRQRGYSIQDEEIAMGLRAIAVPVRNSSGTVIAAINVAVNASRCTADSLVTDYLESLRQVSAEITVRLSME
jgi:IclR family pca regulon transcriptional regulator